MKDLVSRCPIEEVMQVLSGRWPTLLIYYLQDGTKRFSELRRDNPTISHKMLTLELRKLEDAGIVRRTEFGGYPLRVEYDLTPAGERLVPLIDALGSWWEGDDTSTAGVPQTPEFGPTELQCDIRESGRRHRQANTRPL
jgi:DNA-binding HxlR family transcriptional regulator